VILSKRHVLQSELAALNKMISQIPEANVLDRMSLEERKQEIEEALSTLMPPYYEPARGQLIFRGRPTVKSQGVYADFAACALDKYANMIATLGSNQTAELGLCGPLPKSKEFQLMITGTILGSFGFEIEEVPKQATVSSELSPVKAAMDKANLVMELSAGLSDDDIAEVIADISTRSIQAIREFLEVMEKYEATFAIDLGDNKPVCFDSVEQIKRTRERLEPENIIEDDIDLFGKFEGTIPARRLFQFLREEPREIIIGRTGSEIEDPGDINNYIGKRMRIRIHTKQVGASRPRYMLNRYEEIKEWQNI
jgi:hypothetical protein